jgi:hypothetical protein
MTTCLLNGSMPERLQDFIAVVFRIDAWSGLLPWDEQWVEHVVQSSFASGTRFTCGFQCNVHMNRSIASDCGNPLKVQNDVRNERDSNTRGRSPVDFESTPLTTRAPLQRVRSPVLTRYVVFKI